MTSTSCTAKHPYATFQWFGKLVGAETWRPVEEIWPGRTSVSTVNNVSTLTFPDDLQEAEEGSIFCRVGNPLYVPEPVSNDTLFEWPTAASNDFPDWTGADDPQYEQTPWNGATPPPGWYAVIHQKASPDFGPCLEITDAHISKSMSGNDKPLVIWRQAFDPGGGQWVGEGIMCWYAGQEYDEIYTEYYVQLSEEMVNSYYGTGTGQIADSSMGRSKSYRTLNWNLNQADFTKFFDDYNSPKHIFTFYQDDGTNYGTRNKQSFLARGNNDMTPKAYPLTTPELSDGGSWSGGFSESTTGQAVGGGDPQMVDKKNGGFIPSGSGNPIVDIDQVFGREAYPEQNRKWTKIAHYSKMNSGVDVPDGIYQMFIDDVRITNVQDMEWNRSDPDPGHDGRPTVGWNMVMFGGNSYYGLSYPNEALHEEWYAIDQIKIMRSLPDNLKD